jgi:drug/metabolite transporter (DMT)-like permease
MRIYAIVVGLAGLGIMLSADGSLPIPRNTGEWMALASGILWSIATTGMKSRSNLRPVTAAFVFALGAAVASLVIALLLAPLPHIADLGAAIPFALGTGGLWWGISIAALMWATVRLEPARVGILMMSEVLIGAASAALLAGEHLSMLEIIGGVLVFGSGVLEIWPIKQPQGAKVSAQSGSP